jgi:galactokinase
MRQAGALGARLTGAGFGGYALAAVEPSALQPVIEAAMAATGGPAFETRAMGGLSLLGPR